MELVRFGVAMERDLLEELDRIVEARGSTRSEILRDLVRGEVARDTEGTSTDAVGALTLVYDHHVRDLTERLTELQHQLGPRVRATMHVHLSADYCLEVIVMHGLSSELRRVANQILATRGVKRGGLELITHIPHDHAHDDGHHAHEIPHESGRKARPNKRRSTKTGRA